MESSFDQPSGVESPSLRGLAARAVSSPLSAASVLQDHSRREEAAAAARGIASSGAGAGQSGCLSPFFSPPVSPGPGPSLQRREPQNSATPAWGVLSPTISSLDYLVSPPKQFVESSSSLLASAKSGVGGVWSRSQSNEHVSSSSDDEKKPWRKILYERQPYDDSYYDSTFLQKLVLNKNFRRYNWFIIARDSAVVNQEVSAVLLFVISFLNLRSGDISPRSFLFMIYAMTIFGSAISAIISGTLHYTWILSAAKAFFSVFGALNGLTPILESLTAAFANDTIWTLSSTLFFVHVLLFDYRFVNNNSERGFYCPDSVSAAIFASVLLASRLSTMMHSLSLISFAMVIFGLFPFLRHNIKKKSEMVHQLLTWSMTFAVLFYFNRMSTVVFWIYAAGVLTITVGGPIWLLYIQRYKNEISGPWDEAKPARTLEDFLS